MDASRRRQEARARYEELGELLGALLDRSPLLPGSLYEQKSRCGKPRCKCAQGPYRHRLWCLSFVEDGRSRTRTVPAAVRPAVAGLTAEYRRERQARRRAVDVFEALVAHVDALAEARCRQGRRAYARLAAGAQGHGAKPHSGKGGTGQ